MLALTFPLGDTSQMLPASLEVFELSGKHIADMNILRLRAPQLVGGKFEVPTPEVSRRSGEFGSAS